MRLKVSSYLYSQAERNLRLLKKDADHRFFFLLLW